MKGDRKNPLYLVACPMRAWKAGLRNLPEFAALVHAGRCGLQGTTRNDTGEILGLPYPTVQSAFRALERDGWLVRVGRSNGQGREVHFQVSVNAWKILTAEPMPTTLFPLAQTPLKIDA